jgi:hypothetical protein
MDTAQLMAMKDSRPVVMELMDLKAPGRDDEAEKASTRNLSAPKADAVKAIPGQNICKSKHLVERHRVSTFLTNPRS